MYYWVVGEAQLHPFEAERCYLRTAGTSNLFASDVDADCWTLGSVSLWVSRNGWAHFCFMSKVFHVFQSEAQWGSGHPAAPGSHPVQLYPSSKSPCSGAEVPGIVSFLQIQLQFDQIKTASVLAAAWPVPWWCRGASSGRYSHPGKGLRSRCFVFSFRALTSTLVCKM